MVDPEGIATLVQNIRHKPFTRLSHHFSPGSKDVAATQRAEAGGNRIGL
jgi:hypothetical protein